MEIKNLRDLIDALNKLGEPELGYTRFFRGHSRSSYRLEPGIYRSDNIKSPSDPLYLIKNEDKIIRDALTNCPDAFSSSDTLFEKLVKIQHYGYATRLLDLTSNALVALYFAVQEGNNEASDGELIILDIPDAEIKYNDSDVVAILSAISLRNNSFSIDNYIKIAKLQAIITSITYILTNKRESISSEMESRLGKIDFTNYQNITRGKNVEELSKIYRDLISDNSIENDVLFVKSVEEKYDKEFKEFFNKQSEIARLLHDIRNDKPSFAPIINQKDLARVVCVRAKLNNPRIVRQQGSFLLFGMNNKKEIQAEVSSDWKRLSKDGECFIIKSEAKQRILRELKAFGISRQNLFPELDSQAKDIMEKYIVYEQSA